jgi:hypothetical protein
MVSLLLQILLVNNYVACHWKSHSGININYLCILAFWQANIFGRIFNSPATDHAISTGLFSYRMGRYGSVSGVCQKCICSNTSVIDIFFAIFVSKKIQLNFWSCYSLGVVLLVAGYFIHSTITKQIS